MDLEAFANKPSLLGKYWLFRSYDERLALALTQRLEQPEVIGRILAARQVSLSDAEGFLSPQIKATLPDPDHLKDMAKGVDRVVAALENNETIAIFGDYDVDGATSSALLYNFLTRVGGRVLVYIPDRLKEGYGPNEMAMMHLKEQGAGVVITVDCGTNSFGPLAAAHAMGLDVIVIDHHLAEPKLPDSYAVINPNRVDEESPCRTLAAVGVCFLFLVSLNRALREKGAYKMQEEPNLFDFLDIVALGTVCDVMPLSGLNRALVVQGLKIMAQRKNLGLKTLLDRLVPHERPDAYHLGFILGPRINAGGRVGQADLGMRLLTTKDPQEAYEIAEKLDLFNQQRRDIESLMLDEALQDAEAMSERACLVLANKEWHQGVIGIIAGRLKEHYHCPVCIISLEEGIGKGSGRSVPGIDLGALIHQAVKRGLLLRGGGHAMAAGFAIDECEIPAFRAFMQAECLRLGMTLNLKPTLTLDASLSLSAASFDLVQVLERLAPFGMGNPTPRFVFPYVRALRAQRVGRADHSGSGHVRCELVDERSYGGARLPAIAFRVADTDLGALLLSNGDHLLHVVGSLRLDTWGGGQRVQLWIEDVHLA